MATTVLTERLTEPLNGVTTAQIAIDCGTGNLLIDALAAGEDLLVSGLLEYVEDQGRPVHAVTAESGRVTLTLKGSGPSRHWFRLPWTACGAATTWRLQLHPAVASDLVVHSGGGNVTLNLARLMVTRLVTDTGGGNLDVVLPEYAANLSVTARTGAGNVSVAIGRDTIGRTTVEATSGAGNVVVRVPGGIAAQVRATSGLGKVLVDARFAQIDRTTFQSPDYEGAANAVAITAHSGAGNVSIITL